MSPSNTRTSLLLRSPSTPPPLSSHLAFHAVFTPSFYLPPLTVHLVPLSHLLDYLKTSSRSLFLAESVASASFLSFVDPLFSFLQLLGSTHVSFQPTEFRASILSSKSPTSFFFSKHAPAPQTSTARSSSLFILFFCLFSLFSLTFILHFFYSVSPLFLLFKRTPPPLLFSLTFPSANLFL